MEGKTDVPGRAILRFSAMQRGKPGADRTRGPDSRECGIRRLRSAFGAMRRCSVIQLRPSTAHLGLHAECSQQGRLNNCSCCRTCQDNSAGCAAEATGVAGRKIAWVNTTPAGRGAQVIPSCLVSTGHHRTS